MLKSKRFYFPLFDLAWLERSTIQAGLQSDRWTQEIRGECSPAARGPAVQLSNRSLVSETARGDVDDAEAREEAREAAQHEEQLARQLSRHQRRNSEREHDEKSAIRKQMRKRRTKWKDLVPRLKLMYAKWWESDSTLSSTSMRWE